MERADVSEFHGLAKAPLYFRCRIVGERDGDYRTRINSVGDHALDALNVNSRFAGPRGGRHKDARMRIINSFDLGRIQIHNSLFHSLFKTGRQPLGSAAARHWLDARPLTETFIIRSLGIVNANDLQIIAGRVPGSGHIG